MLQHKKTLFLTILVGLMVFPSAAIGTSITETNAAIGEGCLASGPNSLAMGYNSVASGPSSVAIGSGTKATQQLSTAMGCNTTASNAWATAMGNGTTASGMASTAMGIGTKASGNWSTAMGYETTAGGNFSWAGGHGMQLTSGAENTFIWGSSSTAGPEEPPQISTPNAFLIFPISDPTVDTQGKVGIGTPNPYNLLDLGSTLGKKLAVYQGTQGNSFYGFGISSYTLEIYAGADVNDSPAMVVKKTTGRVGIGKIDPGYLLEVNGSAGKPGGGSWSNSSDERLKDITGNYDAGLNEIVGLRPVTFYYKEGNPRSLPSDDEYVGFIAQEVQEIFPEAVSEGSDGYLDFNMHPVNVALVNAVKELKAKNDALESENASLKRDIEKIKKILGI